jgi:hypothetical protein
MVGLQIPAVLLIGLALGGAAPSPDAERSPQDEARVLQAFADRLAEYAKLRKAAAEPIPKLKEKAEPAEISAHEKALGAAVRSARPQARAGDLFSPEVQPILRRALAAELKGPGSTPDRKTVEKEGNPKAEPAGAQVALKVNEPYAAAAPLGTVPPDVLRRLPPLPEELEYRFVGRHLILRDAAANLILDFMLNAAPAPKSGR